MLDPVQVDSLEIVFVDFGCRLEDGEVEVRSGLVQMDFVDHYEYFAHVELVFVVVAKKFLINLPGYFPELPCVAVVEVEFRHVCLQLLVLLRLSLCSNNFPPVLLPLKQPVLVLKTAADFLKRNYVGLATQIRTGELVHHFQESHED